MLHMQIGILMKTYAQTIKTKLKPCFAFTKAKGFKETVNYKIHPNKNGAYESK